MFPHTTYTSRRGDDPHNFTKYLDGIPTKLQREIEPGPCLFIVLKCWKPQCELINVQQAAVSFALHGMTIGWMHSYLVTKDMMRGMHNDVLEYGIGVGTLLELLGLLNQLIRQNGRR